MSTEVAYKIIVESDIADKSVGQLKQDFKDLTDQLAKTKIGTDEYKKTLQSLGVVKGGIQELKQQIQALNPEKTAQAFAKLGGTVASGFAAGQAAVALFGAESEDLTRTLVKVQAATALASGIQGLSGFGKALQTAGLAMQAFALSNPFTAIAVAVTALAIAMYSLFKNTEKATDETNELEIEHKRLTETSKELNRVLDNRITALQGIKGAELEILALQKQKIQNNLDLAKTEYALVAAQVAKYEQEASTLKTASDANLILQKQQNETVVLAKQNLSSYKKVIEDVEASLQKVQNNIDSVNTESAEKNTKLLESLKPNGDLGDPDKDPILIVAKARSEAIEGAVEDQTVFMDTNATFWAKQKSEADEAARFMKEKEQKLADFRLMIQSQTFKTIGELALAFAGKSEASQRRAFNINKAAGIAQTTVDTFVAAQKAYASQLIVGDPTSPIRAAIAAGFSIAAGLARVAIIAKTQFNSAAPSGDGGGAPNFSGGGGGGATPPSFQKPEGTGINKDSSGNFQSFDKTQSQKVYVVESDISSVQKKISVIEKNASY